MPKRRNEVETMTRSEPFAYICEYDASFNPEYEAWSDPGAALTDEKWICAKHTYDVNNSLTRTQWAVDANGMIAGFTNAGNNLSGLTYV